jgi:hypothetical protein
MGLNSVKFRNLLKNKRSLLISAHVHTSRHLIDNPASLNYLYNRLPFFSHEAISGKQFFLFLLYGL